MKPGPPKKNASTGQWTMPWRVLLAPPAQAAFTEAGSWSSQSRTLDVPLDPVGLRMVGVPPRTARLSRSLMVEPSPGRMSSSWWCHPPRMSRSSLLSRNELLSSPTTSMLSKLVLRLPALKVALAKVNGSTMVRTALPYVVRSGYEPPPPPLVGSPLTDTERR